MTVSQQAHEVRSRAREGLPGKSVLSTGALNKLTVINSNPQAVKVVTVTVDAAAADTAYYYEVDGVLVTYTSDGSTSTTEVATGLAAAHNAAGGARGKAIATSSTNVVTLTGITPGLDWTVDGQQADLTIATPTAADSADPIPFGRAIVDGGAHPDGGPTRLGKLPLGTGFTAQVATATITYGAGATYTLGIRNPHTGEVLGVVSEPADTDSNTTASELEATFDAAVDSRVTITVATNVITVTAAQAGFEFELFGGSGETASLIAIANTVGPSPATSFVRSVVGISGHSLADEAATIGATAGEWAANAGVVVQTKGEVWVERPGAVAFGDPVWVELASSNTGKLYNTSSATRVRWPGAKWIRDGRNTSDGIAVVALA